MFRLILFIFLIIFILPIDCQNGSTVLQKPSLCINNTYTISLFSTRNFRITFNRTRLRQLNIHTLSLYVSIEDRKVADFQDHRHIMRRIYRLPNDTEYDDPTSLIIYNLKIQGNYMNRTYINYFIETQTTNNRIHHINCSITLIITEPQRLIDKIFKNAIPYIIIFISIQMGILLDREILKQLIRRPIQVVIGFVCQYFFMPLLAYAISKIFRYEPLYGLGLFVVGCCPGGTASNQWTVIFDGDLDLSVFMSFASTVASFVMMPLWLYTLGQHAYLRELKIHVPFLNLAISLLTIIGPLSIGMVLVYFFPKLKPLTERVVKPMLLLLICYFFIFGGIVNFYLIYYVDLLTALSSPLLPWLGFLLGGFIAWICKQDWKRIMTIGIETGIQNVGIAFMVLLYSFPSPESSQATVIPLIVAHLTPQPFYIILIYRLIRGKCCKPKKKPINRKISVDTLSKTTRQLSEVEEVEEPPPSPSPEDIPQTRKISIPISALDLSPNSKPVEI